MKRDPRGFRYALEPLRRKCGWELEDARLTVVQLSDEIAQVRERIATLQGQLDAELVAVAERQGRDRVIHIDQHLLAASYIASLRWQVDSAHGQLAELENKRDEAINEVHRLQKLSEGLDEHRDEAIEEYARALGTAAIVEADDAWLRGTHWRRTQ
ncbi:MAG: hypothetical protein JO218_02320 [Burkholderiales bacterium]|nr:hypothetical protein [Burkholderiales bacterium]